MNSIQILFILVNVLVSNYFKAYEDAGKLKYINFDKSTGKDFLPISEEEVLINNYLETQYCLKNKTNEKKYFLFISNLFFSKSSCSK